MTGSASVIERIARLERRSLANFPTPLIKAERLSSSLGCEIWFKRDDLISFGFGGNKVRGLEFIVADALAQDADSLVTGAGAQSNHVRATAAVAQVLGLECHVVLWGDAPRVADGNFRLTRLLGAHTHFTGSVDRITVDTGIAELVTQLELEGKRPYPVPRGGASPLGGIAHVLAVDELARQCREADIQPDAVVLAVGSGTSYAGWSLGSRLLGLGWRVEGFTISRPAEEIQEQVRRIVREMATTLQVAPSALPRDFAVHDGFIGDGYGIPSQACAAAIRDVMRCEAVLLDPTYTGKAMAGLLANVRDGPWRSDRQIVFIHSGGEPAFFAGDGAWLHE